MHLPLCNAIMECNIYQGVGFFVDPSSCILYLLFLGCSGYCACSETAYTAVSKVRLRTMADKGNKRAKKALWVCDRFDKTLTTILIGNNLEQEVGILMEVGASYIVLKSLEPDTVIVCDMFSIKFVTIIYSDEYEKLYNK
mgnify:CR=1 FL=1